MSRTRRTAVLVATGCAAWIVAAPAALALCAAASEESHLDRATIVFEGVAEPGDAVDGRLLSPATFRVERYLKGDGPSHVPVATATVDAGDGLFAMVSVGISPSAGERWRIFASGTEDGIWATSTCAGSQRLASGFVAADASDDVAVLVHDPTAADPDGSPTRVALLMAMLALAGLLSLRLAWRRGT